MGHHPEGGNERVLAQVSIQALATRQLQSDMHGITQGLQRRLIEQERATQQILGNNRVQEAKMAALDIRLAETEEVVKKMAEEWTVAAQRRANKQRVVQHTQADTGQVEQAAGSMRGMGQPGARMEVEQVAGPVRVVGQPAARTEVEQAAGSVRVVGQTAARMEIEQAAGPGAPTQGPDGANVAQALDHSPSSPGQEGGMEEL